MAADGAIWIIPAMLLLGSYLLGSIPFGIVVTRMAGANDPRTVGSGNIGATNVLRSGRKDLAAITLWLDGAKGAVAVLVAERILPGAGGLAAIGVFYGHIFPVWLRFRGGKGIATFIGLALAAHWPSGLAFLFVWLAVSAITRRSSAGGISGALATPVAAAVFDQWNFVLLFLAFALTVVWTHRANIARPDRGNRAGDRQELIWPRWTTMRSRACG